MYLRGKYPRGRTGMLNPLRFYVPLLLLRVPSACPLWLMSLRLLRQDVNTLQVGGLLSILSSHHPSFVSWLCVEVHLVIDGELGEHAKRGELPSTIGRDHSLASIFHCSSELRSYPLHPTAHIPMLSPSSTPASSLLNRPIPVRTHLAIYPSIHLP